jgi:leukemia factor-related protein
MALRTLLSRTDLLTMPALPIHEVQKKEAEWQEHLDVTAAFLGPTLWNKTLPFDGGELKIPPGVDLYEFLSEPELDIGHISSLPTNVSNKCSINDFNNHSSPDGKELLHVKVAASQNSHKIEQEQLSNISYDQQDESDEASSSTDSHSLDEALASVPGQRGFDPKRRAFSEEELKPQPMSKKSRKQFVPDQMKDDKYWARRTKNNMAAKRSRDARRIKENQIALRASFLEKENNSLRLELENVRRDNEALMAKLRKYET